MNKNNIHVLIMAGGKGERFWPHSRQDLPKQFLRLNGTKTLIAETCSRLNGWVAPSHIWVLTNKQHVGLVRKLCPQLKKQNVIGEPMGKDTAPCIAVAASLIAKKDPNAVMIVLPADHWIAPKTKFKQVLLEAAHLAQTQKGLVTLGIKPRSAHTGYGYIQIGKTKRVSTQNPFFEVKAFKEKPDLAKAKKYLKSGNYYWNSGIFIWRADAILQNIKRYLPKVHQGAQKIAEAWGTKRQTTVLQRSFKSFQKISIDYGVLEKAENVSVAVAPFHWDDLGSWSSLSKYLKKDDMRNALSGRTISEMSSNCVVISQNGLVATLGVSNLIVVSTPDVTLIASKRKEQEIKALLTKIRQKKNLHPYL